MSKTNENSGEGEQGEALQAMTKLEAFALMLRGVTDAAIHTTLNKRSELASVLRKEADVIERTQEHDISPKEVASASLAHHFVNESCIHCGVHELHGYNKPCTPSVVDGNVTIEHTGVSSQDSPPSSTVAGAQEKNTASILDAITYAAHELQKCSPLSSAITALDEARKILEKKDASADNVESVLQKARSVKLVTKWVALTDIMRGHWTTEAMPHVQAMGRK